MVHAQHLRISLKKQHHPFYKTLGLVCSNSYLSEKERFSNCYGLSDDWNTLTFIVFIMICTLNIPKDLMFRLHFNIICLSVFILYFQVTQPPIAKAEASSTTHNTADLYLILDADFIQQKLWNCVHSSRLSPVSSVLLFVQETKRKRRGQRKDREDTGLSVGNLGHEPLLCIKINI